MNQLIGTFSALKASRLKKPQKCYSAKLLASFQNNITNRRDGCNIIVVSY